MNRAYSILDIKSVNEDERVIEGVASTPTADRIGDIVDPMGAKFAVPMPLLWQHNSDQPIGQVTWAKATKGGIPFKAQIASLSEPGTLKDRLDEAWQSIKLGLVRAVSIGFNPIKFAFLKDGSGMEFQEWEWLELSAVTIPANAEATINVIRSIDSAQRAATGEKLPDEKASVAKETKTAGASARTTVKAQEAKMAKKTIAEQISAFEATRAAKAARMTEIMDESTEKGETLAADQSDEYETLKDEIKKIDEHLVRLNEMKKFNETKAVPVSGETAHAGSESRGGVVVQMKANRPAGIGMARVVIAKMAGWKAQRDPVLIAEQFWPSDPEIAAYIKTAVTPGDTTTSGWASQLVVPTNMPSEFVEFLRPKTVLGRIPGFRMVPFNITVPTQTAGTSGHWVGEGKAKPLGRLTTGQLVLRRSKCATIVVFNEELARFSSPSVEMLVRDDLANGIAQFLDEQFFDPSISESNDVNPPSITNGATTAAASGDTIASVINDFKTAFANFQAANVDLDGAVIVMQTQAATGLGMMVNALGQQQFPAINSMGGQLFGLPVYTTTNVGSGRIVIFKPSEILVADDGGVSVDISNEASLQMDDSPTAAAQSLVSLWQTNRIAVRAERYINWKPRRDDAVYYITAADYGAGGTA
jgi:HK97 family phage major capsid protein/HK97 family phage prohead protease